MSIYINPTSGSKEKFLLDYALSINTEQFRTESLTDNGLIPVVLVSNGLFHAALVVCSEEERELVLNPKDNRAKDYFLIERCFLNELAGISESEQQHAKVGGYCL